MDTQEHMTKLGGLFEDFIKVPQFSVLTENNKVKLFDVWLRRYTEVEFGQRATASRSPAPPRNSNEPTPKQIGAIKRFISEGILDADEIDFDMLTKKTASDLISNGYAMQKRSQSVPAGGAASTTI